MSNYRQTEAEDLADLRNFEAFVRTALGYDPDSQVPPDSASVIAEVQAHAALCKRLRTEVRANVAQRAQVTAQLVEKADELKRARAIIRRVAADFASTAERIPADESDRFAAGAQLAWEIAATALKLVMEGVK